MAVMTPDSALSELHVHASQLVDRGNSPDEVCERLPMGGDESDAALWLYSWALAQRRDEQPPPPAALPPGIG
ncbi:MAG: hypothetical protein QOG63_886 [Thermoleophilaceae bacterium]|jgi:hypothetical protein|nr:hypothetical protein [Thermoleophilaceae bacterium]